jgi:predicted NUDIX family NTP pyrophosphohydrolase
MPEMYSILRRLNVTKIKTTTYYVEIPTSVTIKMSAEEFDKLTMFNFEDVIEKRLREQVPLFNDHVHIPVDFFDFSNSSVVDKY